MIRVDTRQLQQVVKSLQKNSKASLNGLALEVAEHLAQEAKQRTPVDTGALRAAWQAAETGHLTAVAKNNVAYASFVEFDTRHWISRNIVPGVQFMAGAKAQTKEALPKITKEHLTEKLRGYFSGK